VSTRRSPRLRIKDLPPSMQDAAREAKRREADAEAVRIVRHFSAAGLPAPTREHRFEPSRKWRLDLAWPAHRLALEVEGGVWMAGRHTRGSGYLRDVAKYNRLAVLGWRLLRCTPETLYEAETLELVRSALEVGC
jgi:hypothetical protein